MNNNLITEIYRTQEIMGIKSNNILLEQVSAVNMIRKVLTSSGDDVVKKYIKVGRGFTQEMSDDLFRKFKSGNLTDDELKLFLKKINWNSFAKDYISNPNLFGESFILRLNKDYKGIIKNPSKYNKVLGEFNDLIDDKTYFPDMPTELRSAIKRQIKSKMDDALSKSKPTPKPSPKPSPKPIIDDSFTKPLTSVTPSEFDDMIKNLTTKLGVKLNLKGKNLELFRDELINSYNQQFTKTFPKSYSSQLSFVTNKINKLPPSQQKALLTNVQTDLEKAFGDVLNKTNINIGTKQDLIKFLKMGFNRPYEGSVSDKFKYLRDWWVYTIKTSLWISGIGLVADAFNGELFDRFLSEPGKEGEKYLRKILFPVWNILESLKDTFFSLYDLAIETQTEKEGNDGSLIDKGESELFKRKIMKKYPSFKFINNITIKYGQPYLKNNDIDYPIYEDSNGRYFIEVDNEGIYFENLTN